MNLPALLEALDAIGWTGSRALERRNSGRAVRVVPPPMPPEVVAAIRRALAEHGDHVIEPARKEDVA